MSQIVMLLSNPFRPDPRVQKEANSLAECGYKVTILCWDRAAEYPARETLPSNIQVVRVQNVRSEYGIGARQLLRLPQFWKALQSYLNAIKPDLIHCHDFDTLPAGLLWGRLHRKPVVYDAHEYYADLCKPRLHGPGGETLYQIIHFTELRSARLASAVITVDDTLGSIYRIQNPRVIIVGHYPSRMLVPEAAPVFTRDTLDMLYTGRLSRDRGLLYYLKLLRSLLERDIPVRLHLAGAFTPESERNIFTQQLGDLHSYVIFHGWVEYEELPRLLTSADLGLAVLMPEPRYIAAQPVKLFEYMAAGLPVIASNFPPIMNIINTAECGTVVDPLKDPGIAAEQIASWWQQPEIPRQLGDNGRKAILEQYNWERLTGQLNDLYKSLLKSSG